ncbi:BMP family protein [Salinibacterium sp. GXW1014]|uniref:BMP family lipoprotein n=1 Tax=Salinibacterium sp. GXW1014 TaxID=3377838 RepID=UPI00383A5C3E
MTSSTSFLRIPAASAVVLLALAGCAAAPEESPDAAASDYTACMVANSGNLEDRSFNQASYEALQRAESELGIELRTAVSQSEGDYETNINAMADAGCDYILTVGWELAEATAVGAETYPDINFSIVDETVEGDNIRSIVYDTAQAAFLAGYLAAGLSQTGVVGTFGGGNQPPVTVFMDGYWDGVQHYNAEKGTNVRVVGWDKPSQTGSFTDDFVNAVLARTLADGLIEQGADIIMPVAAQAGEGAATAALEAGGVGIIWVDADGYETLAAQFQPLIVTTVLKQMSDAVFEIVSQDLEGEFEGGSYIGTLENNGVALAPFHDWESKVPAELAAELDALRDAIIAGEIVVESEASPR